MFCIRDFMFPRFDTKQRDRRNKYTRCIRNLQYCFRIVLIFHFSFWNKTWWKMNCNLKFSRGFHRCQNQVVFFFFKWRSLRKFLSFIATVWQVLGGRIQHAQVRQTWRHPHLAGVHHGDLTVNNPDHPDTEGKSSRVYLCQVLDKTIT